MSVTVAHVYGIHPGDSTPQLKIVRLGSHTYGTALPAAIQTQTLSSQNALVQTTNG